MNNIDIFQFFFSDNNNNILSDLEPIKRNWYSMQDNWGKEWSNDEEVKIKTAIQILQKGIEKEREAEEKFFKTFFDSLEQDENYTKKIDKIKNYRNDDPNKYKDTINLFNAILLGENEAKRRLGQISEQNKQLSEAVEQLQAEIDKGTTQIKNIQIKLKKVAEIGAANHQDLVVLLSSQGASLTNDIETFSKILIEKLNAELKNSSGKESLEELLTKIYYEVFNVMKTGEFSTIEKIVERAIDNVEKGIKDVEQEIKKTDLSSITRAAIKVVDIFSFSAKKITKWKDLSDLIKEFNNSVGKINIYLKKKSKLQIREYIFDEEKAKKKSTIKQEVSLFLKMLSQTKNKINKILGNVEEGVADSEEAELSNLIKFQEILGESQIESTSEIQISSNDKNFRTPLEETLTALAFNSLKNFHVQRHGQAGTKDDIRGFALFSGNEGQNEFLQQLSNISLETEQQIEGTIIEKEGSKAVSLRKRVTEIAEEQGIDISKLFEIRITNKFYSYYDPNFAFHGGSLGGNVEQQLYNIEQLYKKAGEDFFQDRKLLAAMIYNAGPDLLGYGNKDPIEKYLSAAVFLMFDDALANFNDWFKETTRNDETTGINVLHLYSLQGYLLPASFVLQQILTKTKELTVKFYENSSPVRIINPVNKSNYYAFKASFDKQSEKNETFYEYYTSNFFNQNKHKVKISTIMAVNFLDMIKFLNGEENN